MPPMLEPRASPSVGSVNGKIYVFGGDQIYEVIRFHPFDEISRSQAAKLLSQIGRQKCVYFQGSLESFQHQILNFTLSASRGLFKTTK